MAVRTRYELRKSLNTDVKELAKLVEMYYKSMAIRKRKEEIMEFVFNLEEPFVIAECIYEYTEGSLPPTKKIVGILGHIPLNDEYETACIYVDKDHKNKNLIQKMIDFSNDISLE